MRTVPSTLALLLLCSCGTEFDEGPTTRHGVRVVMSRSHQEWIRLADVIRVIDATTAHFATLRAHDRTRLENLLYRQRAEITLVVYPFRCGEDETPCYGTFTPPNLIRVVATEDRPLCASSLAHELVHFFAHHAEGDSNPSHDDPGLFREDQSVTLATLRECDF